MAIAALSFMTAAGRAEPARAAETAPADTASVQARRHYEEGTKAFNLGEFARAIAEFRAAYNAKPDPLLLYNIAQSYRLAGDAVQAAFFYKSFLRNMPNAPNRKEVEGRIKTLEKQIAEKGDRGGERGKEAGGTTPPPAGTQTFPPPETGRGPAAGGGIATTPPPGATGISDTGKGPNPTPTTTTTTPTTTPPATTAAGGGATMTPPSAGAGGGVTSELPATGPTAAVDLTAQPPAETDEPGSPIYKRWWFWTGVGVLLLVALGAAAAAAKKTPDPALGLYDPMFTREMLP